METIDTTTMDDRSTDCGGAPTGWESNPSIPLSTVFALLARCPRRQLLYCLHQRDDRTVPLDALVRRLAKRDVGDPSGLRIALHHVHLPKLDAAGVVDYDTDGGTVRYLGDPLLDDLLEWGIREEPVD